MCRNVSLCHVRAHRVVEIGIFFASGNYSVIIFNEPNFEAVDLRSEIVSDLLDGLIIDPEEEEFDPDTDRVWNYISDLLWLCFERYPNWSF